MRRSAKWTSYPADVLPLTVAEMDVRLAEPIAQQLLRAVDGSDTGYAGDTSELVAAFSAFSACRWGWDTSGAAFRTAADVAVGATEMLRLLAARGRVVVTPPVYPPFYAWISAADAEPVEVPLLRTQGALRLDIEGIERAFATGVQAMLLCNPHNPTGTVASREELVAVADAAARYGVTIIADEVHAPLVAAGQEHVPYLSVSDNAAMTGFAMHSASKAWNLAGLKCALLIATDAARFPENMPHELPWGVGHFGVKAAEAAYSEGAAWLDQVVLDLGDHALFLDSLIRQSVPVIGYTPPAAGFLAWLDVTGLALPEPASTFFLRNAGVALSDGSDFGPGGASHLRLNFGCSRSVLQDAVERMGAAVNKVALPC